MTLRWLCCCCYSSSSSSPADYIPRGLANIPDLSLAFFDSVAHLVHLVRRLVQATLRIGQKSQAGNPAQCLQKDRKLANFFHESISLSSAGDLSPAGDINHATSAISQAIRTPARGLAYNWLARPSTAL